MLLLCTLIVGVSNAWATDPYYTLNTNSCGNTTNSNYANAGTKTVDGINWSFQGNGTMAPWRLGGKSLTGVDRVVKTTTAMGAAISSIDLTVGAASSITVNSLTLVVASDENFSTILDEVVGDFEANSKITFNPTSGTSWAKDSYYKFIFNVTVSGGSNKFVEFSQVEFYEYTGGGSEPSDPSVATTTTIDDSGITNTDLYDGTEAGSLSAIVMAGEDAVDGATVTWSGNNDEVATIDAETGAVTLVAVGTVTFTATYVGVEDQYKGSSDKYELTVVDNTPIPTHTATFSVNGETSTEEFEEGSDIEFPANPADAGGKTFVGWIDGAIDGVTNEAPSFITSATMGESDITYFAVFADAIVGTEIVKSDILNNSLTGVGTSSSYSAWSGKEVTDGSGAVYAGNSAGSNNTIQLRTNNSNSGVVTTASGGKATKITVEWSSSTSNGRVLNIYGKNKAYESASDLYSQSTQGTLIGTIDYGTSSELDIDDDYSFIGIRSSNGALYLNTITITWKSGTPTTYSGYCTTVAAVAVERPVIELADNPFLFSTTATITCATDGAAIKYSYDGENWSDYSEALTITETKTIYAKAVKGNDESSVAQVTATKNLAEPTVAVSGELTLDLDGETDVEAGTLTAAVTYKEVEVEGAVVTWTSSNTDIAEINETTGAVTIKTTGTVTFTATYAGNSDYAEATGTKTVTVINSKAPGSQAMPYTVAQAIEATPASGTSENVYIHGFVSAFYANDIVSDGTNYRYYISDDGTTTNQLLIYKGKGLEQATFANASDLEIGDEVVIYGGLTTYKSEAEVAAGNYLISRIAKPASDLTKTSDITLDYKNGATAVDLTDYFTTSSDGAITYIVADETVIEKAENMISALKVGTTTVTVSQEASLSYKAGEIVINVTVQDTREDATTIPAINISSLTVGDANGTISVVDPVKADDGVTFSFSSSNEDVLLIDGTSYTVGEVGATTVTVTATTSNANLYKNVTATFDVIVGASTKSENIIGVEFDANTTVYGTALEGLAYGSEGFDGTITAESSNPAVATVSVDEEGNVTVTPVAVGTITITFSAAETPSFYAAENVYKDITITAPEAQTEVIAGVTLFKETFAGNTGSNFSGNQTTTPSEDNEGWSLVKPYGAGDAIKLGTSSISGSATTPAIETTEGTEYTLTFRAAPWSNESSTMNVEVEGGNITGVNDEPMNTNEWNDYTATIVATSSSMTITFTASKNRFFLDDVEVGIPSVTATATIASSGYGTLCSQYPLDFTATTDNNSDYKAWYVTSVEGSTVVLEQVTGAIAGGQAVILCGNAGTYNVPTASSTNTLEGNKLFGTLAPTYIGDNEAYGLKNGQFQMINAGTMPAGKAYLPVSAVPSSNEVKALTLVFNDATGIQRTEIIPATDVVYSLQGVRIQNPLKGGVYIVNGKKVVIK